MASASIGQVHRAKLPDGTAVAVKVQHPGIIEAMESDLKNAAVVEAIIGSMGMAKFDSKRLTEEVKERFREELDYNLEADRQEAFTKIHAGDSLIRIPKIIDTHSSSRVLTSELLTGKISTRLVRRLKNFVEAGPRRCGGLCTEPTWSVESLMQTLIQVTTISKKMVG